MRFGGQEASLLWIRERQVLVAPEEKENSEELHTAREKLKAALSRGDRASVVVAIGDLVCGFGSQDLIDIFQALKSQCRPRRQLQQSLLDWLCGSDIGKLRNEEVRNLVCAAKEFYAGYELVPSLALLATGSSAILKKPLMPGKDQQVDGKSTRRTRDRRPGRQLTRKETKEVIDTRRSSHSARLPQ